MSRQVAGSGFPLIRRTLDGGSVREFVHPADGSEPFERPVGSSVSAGASLDSPSAASVLGQLVGRRVVPADATRPIHVPLLRASCDGGGACCGLFHHVPATTEDRDRIVGLFPDGLDARPPVAELFHPAYDGVEDGPLNVLSVDGSCAFVCDDGLCAVHKAGGALAKPQSCLAFPAVLVACGDEWHASLRPECACLARTALEGVELQADPAAWTQLRGLLVRTWEVPEQLRIDAERSIHREDYVAWMRQTLAELRSTFEPLAVLSAACEQLTGRPAADRPADEWLSALGRRLERSAAHARDTHSPASPYRRMLEWAAESVAALLAGASAEPRGSRGLVADRARRAAGVAGLVLHGHGLLEHPLLGAAVEELHHVFWLASASQAVREAEAADPRLESLTSWLFLWRNLD